MKTILIMKTNNKTTNSNMEIDIARFRKAYQEMINQSLSKRESDVIERFKKGHKIKIKKENVGSFTKYCKGNVTEACIQKGKNSPDPKIRKKATFAANARKWNH